MRKVALTLLLLAAFACKRPAKQASVPPQAPPAPNLLELSRGASVVSRSAELDLNHTPVRMIDTLGATGWVTPAGDPGQSAVVSLPALASIDHVGILTTNVSSAARDVRFDFSVDGENFTRSVTLSAKELERLQIVPVTPAVDAQYVRVATLNSRSLYVFIREVIANGAFRTQPAAGAIDGCWSVNGQPATFHAEGATVFGYVAGADDTMLDGGSDGRFYRFAWTQDKQYGLAAISVTPDGKHLASMVWHEQAIQLEQFYAGDWLGDRGPCPAKTGVDVFDTYLQRFGYFPLYALRFSDDGTLDDGASAPALARLVKLLAVNPRMQARFVAHELTRATAKDNLAVSQKKIATLRDALSRRGVAVARLTFIALGEAHPRRNATSDLTRAMYSSVDLEVRR